VGEEREGGGGDHGGSVRERGREGKADEEKEEEEGIREIKKTANFAPTRKSNLPHGN
jgi:hypothetical protein